MFRRQRISYVRVICMSLTPKGSAVGAALGTLGYKCYDLQTVFSPGRAKTDAAKWALLLQGRTHFELSLVKEYDAICGLPASGCAERVLAELPAYTKVILAVEPDKEQWKAQYEEEVPRLLAAAGRISKRGRLSASWNNMLQRMYPTRDVRGNPVTDPVQMLENFEDLVKRRVPPQRLLVYHVGDGWAPLMHFLDLEGRRKMPEEPFPNPDHGASVLRGITNRLTNAYRYATGFLYAILGAFVFYILPTTYNACTDGAVESAMRYGKSAVQRQLGAHVAPIVDVIPVSKTDSQAALQQFGLAPVDGAASTKDAAGDTNKKK